MNIVLRENLRLTAVPDTIRETLVERLSLINPKWVENHRMGRWNRGTPKILRYYDRVRGGLWIPRGYLRQLLLLCRREGIGHNLEDRRRTLDPIDFTFQGRLKPFQQTAAAKMLQKDFGTLSAPTGSGKTVIALSLIARRRQPTLVIVHTKDLARQWVQRIETFLGIPEAEVGFVGAGKKRVGQRVTVALVQSLYKCAEDISPRIGFLVADECHRCPSRTFTEAVAAFDSRYMLGLTATPWRRDRLSKLIFWHLGDVHHRVDSEQLVESGDVLAAEVCYRETDFRPYHDPVNEYSKMLTELTADDRRNRLIADDVAEAVRSGGGTCLVLSDRKAHCETLQALLRYRHDIPCERLTGDLTDAQRSEVVERLERGEVKVLVATGQLMGEGFDCRELSTLFLATPIRFSGRVLQYLGRVLRPAPGKRKARVFDYVDVHVEVLCAAARARRRVYEGKEQGA
ncbi:MAG: DEAD/DEAH box helicase [Desulfobacteraceae bacterium]|jgi:superfamily II DNA or RNA helicase|nr:DEAD/DEAH box helicase [Desulfobacteraceae bacterium]